LEQKIGLKKTGEEGYNKMVPGRHIIVRVLNIDKVVTCHVVKAEDNKVLLRLNFGFRSALEMRFFKRIVRFFCKFKVSSISARQLQAVSGFDDSIYDFLSAIPEVSDEFPVDFFVEPEKESMQSVCDRYIVKTVQTNVKHARIANKKKTIKLTRRSACSSRMHMEAASRNRGVHRVMPVLVRTRVPPVPKRLRRCPRECSPGTCANGHRKSRNGRTRRRRLFRNDDGGGGDFLKRRFQRGRGLVHTKFTSACRVNFV